ncbi:MAG: hypothetical protein JSU66_11235, partial [Deltaproteobacteria bacterium]
MGSRIQNGIGTGLGLALRSSATSLLLGARWVNQAVAAKHPHVPAPRVNLALASKVALDEVFFASEVLLATLVSLGDRRRVTREITRALSLYELEGWLDEPVRYHRKPPRLK